MRTRPGWIVALAFVATVPALRAGSRSQSNAPAVPVTVVNPTASDCFDGPGCLDVSFGERGRVRLDPGGTQSGFRVQLIHAMAIQPDGRVVVAGQSRSEARDFSWVVARLNANGSLDRSFGDQGLAKFNLAPGTTSEAAYAVVIQPDGRIVVGGWAGGASPDFLSAVVRLTSGGQPDATFGTQGRVVLNLGEALVKGMALQPDGRMLVVGSGRWHAPVVRLMPDGTIDRSFGAEGTRLVSSGLPETRFTPSAIAVLASGHILIGGSVPDVTPGGIAVCRLSSTGALDTSFGVGGRGIAWFPGKLRESAAMAVAADGSVVVAGNITGSPAKPGKSANNDTAFVRFTAQGQIDTRFGTSGRTILDIHGQSDRVAGVMFQPDGRIVFAASARTTDTLPIYANFFVVGKLTADGRLDPMFGTGGVTETSFTGHVDDPWALAIDASGRILVAGSANGTGPGSLMTWAIARYQR